MKLKRKRKELQGLVGGIGVVVAIAGFVGGFFAPATTIVLALAVWIVGTLLVNLLTDPPPRG